VVLVQVSKPYYSQGWWFEGISMMELTARFPQQFATTAWKASFTFLPFNIQLIQKKHLELLGPWTSSFQVGSVKDFQRLDLEKAWVHKIPSFHEHGTINHLGSIHFSYAWLCNWEHPFSTWPKGESQGALHASQALPWRIVPIRCSIMWFLCAPATQLMDQPCTTLSFAVGFKIHH